MSAFSTFGRAQGPNGPPQSAPLFGPSTSSAPPPHRSPTTPPPRRPGAPQRMPSPSLGFESSNPGPGWISSLPNSGVNRGPGVPVRMRLPLGFENVRPGGLVASSGSYRWDRASKSPYKDYDAPVDDITPASQTLVAQDYESGITTKLAQFQGHGNSSSPPLSRNDILRSAGQVASRSPSDVLFDNENHQAPEMTRSPHSVYENHRPVSHFLPSVRAQRPTLSSTSNRSLSGNNAAVMAHEDMHSVSPNVASYDSGRNFGTNVTDAHTLKRARSPLSQARSEASKDNHNRMRNNARTPSPPKLFTSSPLHAEALSMKPISQPANKRTRSPPHRSSDQMSLADSNIFEDDTEREMKAKERRRARFKLELEEKPQSNSVNPSQNASINASSSPLEPREKSVGPHNLMDYSGEFPNGNVPSDGESLKSARIVGLCPDMCPQSEREERERKGDLDQYERVKGDRNQTTEFLAVKKYNRTAEREAILIRPMLVLQRTMDYLLNLLNQPYNEQFLGLYNFLWDRMRAIRMDLRMQHIFNEAAIKMLEQMIRFHIIAMHELCEYTKGEGFSEGFDAHLNIEQMNKASVELFQLYDDHRKKGILLPTEKEFRGYYALLKLDKHPGYKVEPSELSLDLVKMTPEIRQTPEVVFARDVARACRIGNFIAFFRLARKATYLQGCLMHAHFAKLRTQALASLHSGLQSNQGIPVAHVAKWVGMEDEDIEDLLEYHGFLIKEFEEPFMVKEGPFLNSDKDYRTNSSELVKHKRSEIIIEDVLSSHAVSYPAKETKKVQHPKEKRKKINFGNIFDANSKLIEPVAKKCSVSAFNEDINDFEASPSHKDNTPQEPVIETRVSQETKVDHRLDSPKLVPHNFSFGHSSPTNQQTPVPKFSPKDSSFGHDCSVMQPMASPVLFPWSSSYQSSPNTHCVTSPKFAPQSSSAGHGFFDTQKMTNLEFAPLNFSMGLKSNEIQTPEVQMAGKPHHDDIYQDSPHIDWPSNMDNTFSIETHKDIPSASGQLIYDESFSTPGAVTSRDSDMVIDSDRTLCSYQGRESTEDVINNEVVEAKLKLILRLWKRRSSKLKELREERKLAANAALESLSLGPPIRNSGTPPATFGNLNIDNLMCERYKKHVRSWSKLNVPDVVSSVLSRRNPDASCLCWKTVLCSSTDAEDELRQAGSWLRSKLMPARENDENDSDLVISIPGLCLWKSWVSSKSGMDQTCCITCIKDTKCGDLIDTLSGASGIVFLLSEHMPWEIQKTKLHKLLMSLPAGSRLPLLILGGYFDTGGIDPSSKVVIELALNDIDSSQISNFLLILLDGDHSLEHSALYSEEELIKGLQWLASESPPQPDLHLVNTRDLVLTNLDNILDISDKEVGPNHCISLYNEALNQSIMKVAAAADANPNGWPFPEISLLEKVDQLVLQSYLPNIGWSTPASIEPIMGALKDCRLPEFSDDLSWLEKGYNLGHDIEKQRSLLENCIFRYLTDSSKMMGHELATKEAVIMVQKNTLLKILNLSYYLVPQWVQIFRRIFNWRLMTLSRGKFSSVYVLKQHYDSPSASGLRMGNENSDSASLFLEQPSLDELLAVGCSAQISGTDQLLPSTSQSVSEAVPNCAVDEISKTSYTSVDYNNKLVDDVLNASDFVAHKSSEVTDNSRELAIASSDVMPGIENLNNLLQQCNLLQNMVGKKLSIYF